MTRLRYLTASILGALLILGCGKSDELAEQLPTKPARGFVKLRGEPLGNASVSFISLDGKVRSYGRTDGVGSFTLSTYGRDDGAPPGKYKVIVAVSTSKEIEPGVLEDEPPGGFKSPVPSKYSNPQTTNILVEVKEGADNEFTIDLK